MSDDVLEPFKRGAHRIGPDAALAFVKVDPFTNRAYVDRSKLATLADQGYDVDDFARRIEADLRARGKWPV